MRLTRTLVATLIVMAICFISVPLLAATLGGWYAYWGAMIISAIWAVALLWLKTTKYWEEDE
jgi:hypothetical protein